MQRNIGIFISHNCYLPLTAALSPGNLIINKSLTEPRLPQEGVNNYFYELLSLQSQENSSINSRASKMSERITQAVERYDLQKIHIISNGVSGVDARVMLSESPNLNQILETLVTVSSPHQGSRLASIMLNDKMPRFLYERLSSVIGISVESFFEMNNGNIKFMNEFLDDYEDSRIFTISGNQVYNQQSTLFKEISNHIIHEGDVEDTDTDGVLLVKETKYHPDQVLGVFGADHYQMSCLSSDKESRHVYGMGLDFCLQRNT